MSVTIAFAPTGISAARALVGPYSALLEGASGITERHMQTRKEARRGTHEL